MKLSDWFGYPGMLEDQNMDKAIDCMQRMADLNNDMSKAIINLGARIEAIEKILVTHNLARIPHE